MTGFKDTNLAWIGLRDESSAKLYDKWNSGENISFSYWRSGKSWNISHF